MLIAIHKSAKCAMLGLMLLFAGVADVVMVAVDNNGGMETPAVVIETQPAVPVEKYAFAVPFESMLHSGPSETTTSGPEGAVFNEHETALAPAPTAFPLVVPLRT